MPELEYNLVKLIENKTDRLVNQFNIGLITLGELKERVIDVWESIKEVKES